VLGREGVLREPTRDDHHEQREDRQPAQGMLGRGGYDGRGGQRR
jgi:hypothetical protein